jgi:hypothetical protein
VKYWPSIPLLTSTLHHFQPSQSRSILNRLPTEICVHLNLRPTLAGRDNEDVCDGAAHLFPHILNELLTWINSVKRVSYCSKLKEAYSFQSQ